MKKYKITYMKIIKNRWQENSMKLAFTLFVGFHLFKKILGAIQIF